MVKINWDEYKEFKKYSNRDDNFAILLDFVESYYHMINTSDIYEILQYDELGQMMMKKRSIVDAIDLENYMHKLKHG